jgi:stage V sporulation protein R
MSEIASYGGFPKRYPHWKWVMEYEQLQRGYEYNQFRIFELVINSNPCVMYVLSSNTLLDNVVVVAHATGHNDFFKNNIFFNNTDTDAISTFGIHADIIKKYIDKLGYEKVTEFIDHVHRIETLIDPANLYQEKDYVRNSFDEENEDPIRTKVNINNYYMYPWFNNDKFLEKDINRIKKIEQDIMSMLDNESLYFYPQRITKVINEGFASYIDFVIMTRMGFADLEKHGNGITEYSLHKAAVLGGKYSVNPYKLGFTLLLDIEDRWNKGKFGSEWENCNNLKQKENWNLNLNLGKEKVFEVRKYYNDIELIREFFTEEFCEKNEFFEWKKYPNGEYKIEDRNYKNIKNKLLQKHLNGGLPDIRLVDNNHMGRNILYLQHLDSEKQLYEKYTKEVLCSLNYFWKNEVILATRTKIGEDIVYICDGTDVDKDIIMVSAKDYSKHI